MALMTAKELEVHKTNALSKTSDAKIKKVIESAFKLVGTCMWSPQSNIDLAKWKLEPTADPKTAVQMVCWLAPIYIAYKAGVATEATIKTWNDGLVKKMKEFEKSPIRSESNYAQAEAFFKSSTAKPGTTGNPGDIVFFYRNIHRSNPELAKYSIHYAMQITGNMVVSLWNVPNDYSHIQMCSIPTLVDEIKKDTADPSKAQVTVKFAKAPW
jgi:hypothetical protein